MSPDSRLVPAAEGRSELTEKASRFLGFSRRISSAADAKAFVDSLEKEFHSATHVCFAWKSGSAARAADAGEPPGTAGRPILSAIEAAGLEEVAVAVVRYFGGRKLGVAGLARCYREAARLALAEGGSEEVFDRREVQIRVPYSRVAAVRRMVQPPDVQLVSEEFGELVRFRLAVRERRIEDFRRLLAEARIEFEIS